jgi:hypothetical protein
VRFLSAARESIVPDTWALTISPNNVRFATLTAVGDSSATSTSCSITEDGVLGAHNPGDWSVAFATCNATAEPHAAERNQDVGPLRTEVFALYLSRV